MLFRSGLTRKGRKKKGDDGPEKEIKSGDCCPLPQESQEALPPAEALVNSAGTITKDPRQMIIAKAMELREELNRELHCTTCLINDPSFQKEDWAPRIKALIERHHEECSNQLKLIEEAFETTEIII